MNNERAKSIDLVFNRGVRQDLDPHTAPPGALVSCDNLEFDQLGRLVRRDAFGVIGIQPKSKQYGIYTRIRRFAQAPDGARLFFSDDNAFEYVPSLDGITQAGPDSQPVNIRAHMESVTGIAADNSGNISFCDAVSVGGYAVYLYVQPDVAGGSFPCVWIDVIEMASGSRVLTRVFLGRTAGNYPPRLVVSGGSTTVFAIWEKGDAISIQYAKCDVSVSPIAWSAAADLITTSSGPCVFDAISMSSGWAFVYFDTGVTAAIVKTYNSTPTATHSFTWKSNHGANTWTPTVLAICGDADDATFVGSNIHVLGYDNATHFLETKILSTALVSVADSRLLLGLDPTKPLVQMAVIRLDATTTLASFSNYASPTLTTNPRSALFTYTLTDAGTLTSQLTMVYYTLGSRFYADTVARGRSIFAVARFDDPSGFQNHFALMYYGAVDIEYPPLRQPQPVCHFASGRVPLKADNAVTGISGVLDMTSVVPGQFQIVGVVNIGASQISGNQVQGWAFGSRSTKRYLGTECQGELIVGGGTPLAFDGQRFAELSFYSYPVLHSGNITPSNAGGSIAQGVYQYRAVYEWTDALGNRHQSPAAPAVTVDLSSGTYVAGTNSVVLSVPPMQATRKQGGPQGTDLYSTVRVVFYRTTNGGAAFYRLPGGGNNHSLISTFSSYTDVSADASISGNEPIYTTAGGQGLLASTAPPPTVVLTTHAQRLWGVDCENPERIWTTRVLQPGSAPAYNPALQVLIPGAGRINGLGGQDGKLYALATNGVYLASYGDGPDDTGGGSFPSPQLITTTANCTDPRGVLVGQEGIFFTGSDQWGTGIYLIRRGDGTPVSIGKRVRNELAACPMCRGVVNRTGKARTEFLFVDSDTSPTKGVLLYYHHDYLDEEGIGQWTVARVNTDGTTPGVALECLGTWDDQSIVVDTSSEIGVPGWQRINSGLTKDLTANFVSTFLETTDVRPTGLLGFGQIAGVSMLGTQASADPIELQFSYDSGFSWPDVFQFGASPESAGQPVIRRREPLTQKQFDGATIRVRLTNQSAGGPNPGATFFHGIALELVPLGGNARLDGARRA